MARRARPWRCRSCLTVNPVRTRKCGACNRPRPKRRKAAHNAALDIPYTTYVELNGGDFCAICGKTRGNDDRRFHRDHDHLTGKPRGLLCFRDNAAIRTYMNLDWARKLVLYLERTTKDELRSSSGDFITDQTEETTTDGTQEP